MYNYNHLFYFYTTVKSQGVTAAAKHLRISQPSLSSQLKTLEVALDLRLFRKVGRVNELTEAGNVVFGYCRQMFELSEELQEVLAKEVPSVSRRIHIGVSDEVDRPFVADIVSLFLKKHGAGVRPKVFVVSGDRDRLVERLRFRELDAVVTEQATTDPDLKNLEKAEVPVVLTCSQRWRTKSKTEKLSASDAIDRIESREDIQWVMPSAKFKLRSEIDRFFEDNGLTGRIVFESDVMASLVRSVSDEIGLAFLPRLYVDREIRERTLKVLGPPQGYWKYRVWLASHGRNQNDPLMQTLAASFREVCAHAS